MRFTCNKEQLSTTLQSALRVINTSATLEALQGVLLFVDTDSLIVRATNIEVAIELTIPVTDSDNGKALINPRMLLDTIKYSNGTQVTLELIDSNITIKTESGKTKIKTLDDTDFPKITKNKDGKKITINTKNLINGIKSVSYAISHSVIKPELASMYVWQNDSNLTFVATDSFRLAEKVVDTINIDGQDTSLLIPNKNTQTLLSILEQVGDGDVDIYAADDQLSLYVDNMYITLRMIQGVFPDYKKIIPQDPIAQVTILKKDLLNTIKKAGIFSNQFNKIKLIVDVAGKTVSIHTSGNNGETSDKISAVIEGENADLSINYTYLIDCMQSIHTDSVVLSFFGQGKPITVQGIGDKSFTYLVMPMNN